MRIIPITLPTPFYIGPVNVYLIAEDPITLIDTGPKTKEAFATLRAGLRAAGFLTSDIRRIVLTHAHEDHCGLTKSLRDEAKNAEVLIHDWESGHRVGRLEHEEHRSLLARAGVPDDEIETMRRVYEGVRVYGDSIPEHEYRTLEDNAELEFASGSLRVIHTPGHTPGSCSFVREADRTVFAGDCLLKRITPNPVLSLDPINPAKRFHSLAEYLVSLARLRTFSPTLVHGGHGDSINDFEELFHRYLRAIQQRQGQVISLLGQSTPSGATAWTISRALFPDTDDVHRFLAVSEAVAHLDLAHSEGKIELELRGTTELYRPLGTQ